MPRKSRIDAPGALHHVIARGINRQAIFGDDTDRDRFLDRLGEILVQTQTACYAWALLPNHFHLLLRTGATPISLIMRRLLTGHAVYFNLRHQRSGHLFQNRYKSILCQADAYLLELVRYIHLNPLRAGLVPNCRELATFRFCGHAVLMGHQDMAWQDRDQVLRLFAETEARARRRYREFIQKGADQGHRADLVGGRLIRRTRGWEEVPSRRNPGAIQKGDERILGDSGFMAQALAAANESRERRMRLMARDYDLPRLAERIAGVLGIAAQDIMGKSRARAIARARDLLCYWASAELGVSQVHLASILDLTQPAVSLAARRGKRLADGRKLRLEE
jgi:REP element-mobilizing transposase RayT